LAVHETVNATEAPDHIKTGTSCCVVENSHELGYNYTQNEPQPKVIRKKMKKRGNWEGKRGEEEDTNPTKRDHHSETEGRLESSPIGRSLPRGMITPSASQ
jgi:hypothetical protein